MPSQKKKTNSFKILNKSYARPTERVILKKPNNGPNCYWQWLEYTKIKADEKINLPWIV